MVIEASRPNLPAATGITSNSAYQIGPSPNQLTTRKKRRTATQRPARWMKVHRRCSSRSMVSKFRPGSNIYGLPPGFQRLCQVDCPCKTTVRWQNDNNLVKPRMLSPLLDPAVIGTSLTTDSMYLMKILLISDAWKPQVNGVVRTLENTQAELTAMGHDVLVVGPDRFRTVPCPGYPEIPIALRPARRLAGLIESFAPNCIHVATEGPLGQAARSWCQRHDVTFTSSYHTRFPEYLRMRAPVPTSWTYRWLRGFHAAASRTLVRTRTQMNLLAQHGFSNLAVWPGGVDTQLFRPRRERFFDLPRPIALYAGRVAPEKSLEDFLAVDFPGSKVIIGDGPARPALQRRFPEAHFLGYHHGEGLARRMAASDVFVFPSRTDTLGLVMLEAMACDVPVAAFPVPGPIDVVLNGVSGCLDENLQLAMEGALQLDRSDCRVFAGEFTWRHCTQIFVDQLQPATAPAAPQADSLMTAKA
ncbi:MAG: glycosyltransferase family 4 protein [Wenzhouxiangella sp.]